MQTGELTHKKFGTTSPQFSWKSDPNVFVERSRTGLNYGRSFCIQWSVDSKDSPPSCSFSQPKELGPIHTGWKWLMEQEISGISKFPEKRTTSRGEPKFSKRISGKCLFHSILNRNFRKFWSNGTRPWLRGPCNGDLHIWKVSEVVQRSRRNNK